MAQPPRKNWPVRLCIDLGQQHCVVFSSVSCHAVMRRGRKVLENRSVTDEERIYQLQKELEAAVLLGEETDRKFEEVIS